MKYVWFFVVLGIAGIIFFNRFFVVAKNNLAALVQLEPLEQPQLIEQNGRRVLAARIYSTYPFNHRQIIAINAGINDGVQAGMPVTADGNVLLGQVTEVFDSFSSVRTILDQNWKISVRLGSGAADALLIGGQEPRLTLIEQRAAVAENDWVYSAGRDFPYGLKIGTVAKIYETAVSTFKEAALQLPYQINNIRTVYVLL